MAGGQEKWYFTKEQLQSSPSRKCGLDADKELAYRQQAANLIQDMGQRLQVSQLCINTAIVYMHRFYAFHSFTHFHRNSIAAAALFLAAKVEEQPRKLEYVIKVAHVCLHRGEGVNALSNEQYQDQAQDLVFNENVLLQTLGFDVAIDHPHTHVVRTCHLVKAPKDLAQTSYFMASNSLHLTTMCLQYRPTVVACFCIHLASKWSNWQIPQSNEGRHWFSYVDQTVTTELLEKLTAEFLHIFDKCPSRLKKKMMTMSNASGNSPHASASTSSAQFDKKHAAQPSSDDFDKSFDKEYERERRRQTGPGAPGGYVPAAGASTSTAVPPPQKIDYNLYREKREREERERQRLAQHRQEREGKERVDVKVERPDRQEIKQERIERQDVKPERIDRPEKQERERPEKQERERPEREIKQDRPEVKPERIDRPEMKHERERQEAKQEGSHRQEIKQERPEVKQERPDRPPNQQRPSSSQVPHSRPPHHKPHHPWPHHKPPHHKPEHKPEHRHHRPVQQPQQPTPEPQRTRPPSLFSPDNVTTPSVAAASAPRRPPVQMPVQRPKQEIRPPPAHPLLEPKTQSPQKKRPDPTSAIRDMQPPAIVSPFSSPPPKEQPKPRPRTHSSSNSNSNSEAELVPVLKKIEETPGYENVIRDSQRGNAIKARPAEVKPPIERKPEPMPSRSLNGIETDPTLVSNLLKESLAKPAPITVATEKKSPVVEVKKDPIPIQEPVPIQEPTQPTEHKHKKEKKKKEKHKHKDRDKSKEERKKHKKDKDKEKKKDKEKEHQVQPPTETSDNLKITIPRDKLPSPGLKIKIPKERLAVPPPPPQSSLKIKISKDLIDTSRKRSGGDQPAQPPQKMPRQNGAPHTKVSAGAGAGGLNGHGK